MTMTELINLNDQPTRSAGVIPQQAIEKRKRHISNRSIRKCIGQRKKRCRRSSPSISTATSLEITPPLPPSSTAPPPIVVKIPIANLPSLSPHLPSSDKKKKISFKEQEEIRVTIKQLFKLNFFDSYSIDQLSGRGGIINTIQGMLNNQVAYHTIKKVILDVIKAEDKGVDYDASRKTFIKKQCRKIKDDEFEMHLLTKFKSAGASYSTCTAAINAQVRAPNQLPPLSVTAIYNAIKKSKYKVSCTSIVPQSNNNNLIWRQARFNWFAQLLVRMGEDLPSQEESDENRQSIVRKYIKKEWIDRQTLEDKGLTFVKEQVAYFDEIHVSQTCGFDKEKTLIFAKNDDGIYDEDGEINEEEE